MKKNTICKIFVGAIFALFIMQPLTLTQSLKNNDNTNTALFYIEPGPTQRSTLYTDGTEVEVETGILWQPMIGSETIELTPAQFQESVLSRPEIFKTDQITGDGSGLRGLDVIFYTDGTVPGSAVTALNEAATYIESVFTDSVIVNIDVNKLRKGKYREI